MENNQIIGHCTHEGQDVNTFEPMNFYDQDVVLIFDDNTFSRAECCLRSTLKNLYQYSQVTLWYPRDPTLRKRLVKLPWSGVWIEDAEKIFQNRDRNVFYISRVYDHPIGSQGGIIGALHGAVESVRVIDLAPKDIPIVKEIEDTNLTITRPMEIEEEKKMEEKEEISESDTDSMSSEHEVEYSGEYILSGDTLVLENYDGETLPREIPRNYNLLIKNCPNLQDISHIFNFSNIKCENCPALKTISRIGYGYELKCKNCPALETISHLIYVNSLKCKNCPRLMTIYYIPQISELYLENCTSLNAVNFSRGSQVSLINLKNCPIAQLPSLSNLSFLNLIDCPITELPLFPEMLQLRLYDIPIENLNLSSILEILECYDCPNLTNISSFPRSLHHLEFHDCPLLTRIPEIPLRVRYFSYWNTPIDPRYIPVRFQRSSGTLRDSQRRYR